jgi:small conductance mechanosensitive channel
MDWEPILQSVVEGATTFALRVAGALGILFVAFVLGGIARSFVGRGLSRAKVDPTVSNYLATLAKWLIILLLALGSLRLFGIETTSFAALIGAAGLAIGLAFQGTLGNFASGVMLLVFRPYKSGDAVNVSGQLGKVVAIDMFSTILDTFDNRRLIIPNGSIFGSTIENITYHPHRRAEVAVGVAYSADIDQTRKILEQAAQGVPGRLDDPPPEVSLMDLGGSSVNWTVRVWANTADFWAVRQATIRAVKMALDEAGVEIPFPQLDVHLDPPIGA